MRKCKRCYQPTCWKPGEHKEPTRCGLCGFPRNHQIINRMQRTLPKAKTMLGPKGIHWRYQSSDDIILPDTLDPNNKNLHDPLIEEDENEMVWVE